MYRVKVNNILTSFFPFIGVIWSFFSNSQKAQYFSFYVFFILAALSLVPTHSSDIGAYLQAFNSYGMLDKPMPKLDLLSGLLFKFLKHFNLDFIIYYVSFGILNAILCHYSLKSIKKISGGFNASTGTILFAIFFFVFTNPIFITLNSRFHLLIWVLVLAIILHLQGRKKISLVMMFAGGAIHFFGYFMFFVFMFLPLLSKLRFASLLSIMILSAFIAPSVGAVSGILNFIGLSGIASLIEFYSEVLENKQYVQKSWHLVLAQPLLYYAAILSFFLNYLKFRNLTEIKSNHLYELAKIVVLILSLSLFCRLLPELPSRMERISIIVILLWHLFYFIEVKKVSLVNATLLFIPVSFYVVVIWRRLLDQYLLSIFLPTPFVILRDLPIVTSFLGFI